MKSKYSEYKKSKIEWLNEIPYHWNESKAKNTISIKNGYAFSEKDIAINETGNFLIRISNIKNGKIDELHKPVFLKNNAMNNFKLSSDSVFLGMSGSIKAAYWDGEGNKNLFLNQRVAEMKMKKRGSNKFLYYLFSLDNMIEHMISKTKINTHANLSSFDLNNIAMIIPPLKEQDAIANYLDDKVGSLDKLIPALDDQIKNMKDYKKSLIRESLETESIEDIKIKKPTITRLFKMGDIITGNTPIRKTEGIYSEKKTDYEWYSVTDMLNISKNKPTGYLTELGIKKARSVPKGSFLCACIGSTIGKSIVASKKVFINQAINAVVPNNKNNGKYIYYHFLANPDMLKEKAEINVIPIVNKSLFSKIEIPRHEKEEQDLIVKFLDKKVRDIDEAIIALKEQKQNMIDYKKALIHDVVTGKIKVYEEE